MEGFVRHVSRLALTASSTRHCCHKLVQTVLAIEAGRRHRHRLVALHAFVVHPTAIVHRVDSI